MSGFVLASPREADDQIARVFEGESACELTAREDMAFKPDQWFGLGQIKLFPISRDFDRRLIAVRRGQYEWKLPAADVAWDALEKILAGPPPGSKPAEIARRQNNMRRSLDAMAGIAARIGLLHPRFDSHSLAMMPYRRRLSVVADTSGIVQGALDFVARFLSPVARTKVPAISQMEIVNFTQRFLSNSRSGAVRGLNLLLDHLNSQGAQRVLLRLELHTNIEIERTFLLGDPLRSAFAKDDDQDIKDLNLSTDVPAYADRMIVEAARHHQMQGGPGHQVLLLTSDHGLAKMAIAEGISPLYFHAVEHSQLFGRRLTGANLHPFGGQIQCTSISSLLWECAVAFGRAKLSAPDGTKSVEVASFGKEFSWSPFHSRGDLLWMRGIAPEHDRSDQSIEPVAEAAGQQQPEPTTTNEAIAVSARSGPTVGGPAPALTGWYQFKLQTLFDIIEHLDDRQQMTEGDVLAVIGTKAKSGAEEYRRLLRSGNLIPAKSWASTPDLQKLAIALRQPDLDAAGEVLRKAPSVASFFDSLQEIKVSHRWDGSIINRGVQSYMALGEVFQFGATIAQDGYYPTPNHCSSADFAPIALAAFKSLDNGDGLISTGAWLELLIKEWGIHPESARDLLRESSAAGLLQRSTEGSTIDVRHDDHRISVLRIKDGRPVVEVVHLYRGDYLIPGKSSSSLRIGAP